MDGKAAEVKAEEDRSGNMVVEVLLESPPVVQDQVEEPSSSNVTAADVAAKAAELAVLHGVIAEKNQRIRELKTTLFVEKNFGRDGYAYADYLKWKEETQAALLQIVEKQKLVYKDVRLEKLLDQLKMDHEIIGYDSQTKAFR